MRLVERVVDDGHGIEGRRSGLIADTEERFGGLKRGRREDRRGERSVDCDVDRVLQALIYDASEGVALGSVLCYDPPLPARRMMTGRRSSPDAKPHLALTPLNAPPFFEAAMSALLMTAR